MHCSSRPIVTGHTDTGQGISDPRIPRAVPREFKIKISARAQIKDACGDVDSQLCDNGDE